MSKAKTIVSGVSWTVIQNVVGILYGIVSVPFLINYFGKEEYGLIGIALSVNVYVQLLDMGMTNSNVRFFSEYIAKGDIEKTQKLFSLVNLFYFIVGLINTFILFGFSFYVDTLFKVTFEQAITLRNLLWILALNATFSWISSCFDQFLKANELIDWIKRVNTFLKLLQFVILGTTLLCSLSIELYLFAYIFVITLILPFSIIKTKKISPDLKIKLGFDNDTFRTVFPYAISIFSFSIFQFTALNIRPLFMGNMFGPSAVADFNVMNTIAMVVTILSGSFMQVLLPIVTKMTVHFDENGINKIVSEGTKYVVILLSFVIFLLIISINEIFTIYVGESFEKLSNWMIFWLLTLLLSHRNVMTSLVFTEKKLKSVAVMGALAMIIAILCYIFLIPRFGVGGVVIGFFAHELIHTLFYYIYFLPSKFNIDTKKILFKSVLPSWFILGVISLVIIIMFNQFNLSNWMSLIIKSCMYCAIVFVVIWKILLNKQDKQFVLSFVKRKG